MKICIVSLCMLCLGAASLAQAGPLDALLFSCEPGNDLFTLVQKQAPGVTRFDTPEAAISQAPKGTGVLLLAQGYPDATTKISQALYKKAVRKNLRLYVEFPDTLPGVLVEAPVHTKWERAVVSSEAFAPALETNRILAIHDCTYVPIQAEHSDIVVARIAGFDTAVYGIPQTSFPILTTLPKSHIIVSTTKLSQWVTARYSPVDAWQAIWSKMLQRLTNTTHAYQLKWTPTVRPSYTEEQPLPGDAERRAARRGAEWFFKARMFIDASWTDLREDWHDRVGPVPDADWALGDGSLGMLEGMNATILKDGSQYMRWWFRYDCMSEAAMALSFDAVNHGQERSGMTARNLNDFIYVTSVIPQGPRGDKNASSYGLLSWNVNAPSQQGIFYGDDNARGLMSTMASAALLKQDKWDESLLRAIMANFRTAGRLGFRQRRHGMDGLEQSGWQSHFESSHIHYAPHFQCYIWACYLWAYEQTGYAPLLERTRTGVRMMMEAYPHDWRWTNGLQQERARMLLPLSWLIRVEDTPQHRAWLRRIGKDVLAHQARCGAIREELGVGSNGTYGPPRNNEAYGTNEAPLIQENGDPLADLLYTTNFAFIGLHEAAAATGEPFFIEAANKLAEFLCRIQVRSEDHPELDGAWFRAFDFDRWDYWASNADHGWGAWSIESGWTCGWIVAVLNMRDMNTSLWDMTHDSQVERHMDKVMAELFGDYNTSVPLDKARTQLE